jgi:hypothetical protein
LSDFIENEFSEQKLEKYSNAKFYENPFSVNRVVPCGRTDRQRDVTMIIVAFRNFANAPVIGSLRKWDEVTWTVLIWLRIRTRGGLL